MISAGWLSQTDGGLQFSNHAAHNGQTAKQRANTARRVSLHRSKCNDGSVTKALPEKRREKKKEVIYSEVFELFWSECPRKTGKGVAAKAFSSAVGRGHSAESITEAMSKFAIAQWPATRCETDLQYCPHPATWLNGDRFLDDVTPWKQNGNGQTNNPATQLRPMTRPQMTDTRHG